ncbi:MAG: hypothetical protein GXO03_06000 [Aquificae bacterium]|nr:hypothetical protein [Aquificota bacterium]
MPDKLTRDVLFLARLFTLLYLALFLFLHYERLPFEAVSALSVYFLANVLVYLFTRTRLFKRLAVLLDLTLVPLFVYFTRSPLALFSIGVLVAAYASRKPGVALLLSAEGALLAFLFFKENPLVLSAVVLFFIGVLFASYNFEYAVVMSKERKQINKLRRNYRLLLKELSELERERKRFALTEKLFELVTQHREPESYLEAIKKTFGLKSVKVVPARRPEEEVLKDPERGVLVVFVKFDRGYGSVVYELGEPFRLADPYLEEALVKAAKLLTLLVEGFEREAGSVTVSGPGGG